MNALRKRGEVRWGIIGCGDVTEVKSGPALQNADRSKLVAVMRRNGALAEDYARRHGVARWYDSADALIGDPEVDAVYIATPPDAHASLALKVAAGGKPAYVEKPMARHAAECDRMVDAFERAKLPLFVAYYRRRLPRFLAVERMLKDGVIGNLTAVTYCLGIPAEPNRTGWRTTAAISGGGQFLDTGSHVLDLLDYFLGPLEQVTGTAANVGAGQGVEEVVSMAFGTNSAVTGTAVFNYAAWKSEDSLRFIGTEGELVCSIFGNQPVRHLSPAGERIHDLPNPRHIQQPLIQSVVDALLGRGECPSTGKSARRTSRVMDLVLSNYYGGRDDDFWTRPHAWPRNNSRG